MKTEDHIKTTFVLRKEVYDEDFKKYLFHGIGRDAFVSLHLRDALCELAQYKKVDLKTTAVNRTLRRFERTTKKSLTLLREDVDMMNKLCKEKGILRDAFFEDYLAFLGKTLKDASSILENPFTCRNMKRY